MIKKAAFAILSVLFLTAALMGQNVKTDSLLRVLASARADTAKVNILLNLAKELYRSSPQEALKYSNQAIELAQEAGYQKGLALAYKYAGLVYYVQGDFTQTLKMWQEANNAFASIGDKAGIANISTNMGAVYDKFGEDTKALDLYFQAQRAATEIGDSLRLATTYINIGAVYVKKPATVDKAIESYLMALPIAQAIQNYDAIGTASVNLGEAYFKKGDYPSALAKFRESLDAYARSSTGNIPYTYTNIGNVYAKQGDFESALLNLDKALKLAVDLGAKPEMISAYLGMADTYRLKGDIPRAIDSFKKAQALALEINANFELRDAYAGLAQLNAEMADYRNAYLYQSLLTDIREKLYLSSNDNLLKMLQLGNDLVKKEGEVEVQKIAIQKQRIVKNAFLAGLILILVIAFIILRNYMNKVRINKLLDKQNAQIESLLLNILPVEVARELQDQGSATPRDYPSVSVLFTDFKDFSKIAEGLSPNVLVSELNEYFQAFDNIVEKNNLEKIKTIGDAYMCAGGIPTENTTHPINVIQAGLEMQEYMRARSLERIEKGLAPWGLRIGVHTGPVVAGVVGRKKYAYDIWGNTVNIASRMESNGEVGKVNISAATYELVRDEYNCDYRGKIYAKNIGEIDMYFIEGKASNN
jgi:class 3 adenylate cyclase/tetratricopeptide (TPR) repeat protein